MFGLVHRPERLIEIITLMRDNNIEPKKLQIVYPKKNKEAKIILIEGRKNGKCGLKIMKPIIAHLDNGNYTEEVMTYFS